MSVHPGVTPSVKSVTPNKKFSGAHNDIWRLRDEHTNCERSSLNLDLLPVSTNQGATTSPTKDKIYSQHISTYIWSGVCSGLAADLNKPKESLCWYMVMTYHVF